MFPVQLLWGVVAQHLQSVSVAHMTRIKQVNAFHIPTMGDVQSPQGHEQLDISQCRKSRQCCGTTEMSTAPYEYNFALMVFSLSVSVPVLSPVNETVWDQIQTNGLFLSCHTCNMHTSILSCFTCVFASRPATVVIR